MSDSIPVPEEVEELLSEASIEVKTVKMAAKTSEPMWRAISQYFGRSKKSYRRRRKHLKFDLVTRF